MSTEIKELNRKLADLNTKVNDALDRVGSGGSIDLTSDAWKDAQALNLEAKNLEEFISVKSGATRRDEHLSAPMGADVANSDAVRAGLSNTQRKSLGQQFIDSSAFAEMKAAGFSMSALRGGITVDSSIENFSSKDVFGASAGTVAGIPGLGSAQQLPLVTRQVRPTRVRDLFPQASTTASVLYGVRQTGFTNNAAPVAQRRAANETGAPTGGNTDVYGRKPKSTITLTTVTYPVATIAHLLDVHKNVLDDEPRLRGILDTDMIDGVKLVEDEEILYGDGVGENIRGLLNTTGIQEYTQQQDGHTTDKKSAAIRRAATRALLSYYTPTGVVMHPYDWEDLELETDDNGSYRIALQVTTGAANRIWKMDVVDSPAILQGSFLLGGFGTGAKLYDREAVKIEISTESRDNFERNVVTLRAEERIALTVDRPESFVLGTFI